MTGYRLQTTGILKIFLCAAIAFAFCAFPKIAIAQDAEGSVQTFPYEKEFVISAYYSPLPDQTKYVTGTFEGDVRLNGEGVWAADGTIVYPGIAAAPKNLPFGTKIKIPGFGTVSVHDRGGAIKDDRLDIWVGSGEEGLRRALGWGKRKVLVTVYGVDDNIKESVDIAALPLADISNFSVRTKYFNKDLSLGDTGEDVRTLQRFLKKLDYFENDDTGYFGKETQDSVIEFQLAENIIPSRVAEDAGIFGPKTRVSLERALQTKKINALANITSASLKRGDTNEEIKKLQTVLNEFGFLTNITGVYDAETQHAITKFQTSYGILGSQHDSGAGFYGPKTRAGLNELIANYFTPAVPAYSAPQTVSAPATYAKILALNDKGPEVELIQAELKRLNFFGLEPTGYFGKTTEHAVFKFQQKFGIVEDVADVGAGMVGPRTLAKLNELAEKRTEQKRLIAQTTDQKQLIASRIADEKQLVLEIAAGVFSKNLAYGARGKEVEELQRILKHLGFFQGRMITQYYGDITQRSITAFQESHGVAASGRLDDPTRKILNQLAAPPQSS